MPRHGHDHHAGSRTLRTARHSPRPWRTSGPGLAAAALAHPPRPAVADRLERRLAGSSALVAIVFDQLWILAPLAYGFVARVLTGPTLSPLGQAGHPRHHARPLGTAQVRPRSAQAFRSRHGCRDHRHRSNPVVRLRLVGPGLRVARGDRRGRDAGVRLRHLPGARSSPSSCGSASSPSTCAAPATPPPGWRPPRSTSPRAGEPMARRGCWAGRSSPSARRALDSHARWCRELIGGIPPGIGGLFPPKSLQFVHLVRTDH